MGMSKRSSSAQDSGEEKGDEAQEETADMGELKTMALVLLLWEEVLIWCIMILCLVVELRLVVELYVVVVVVVAGTRVEGMLSRGCAVEYECQGRV
jgi:hypothetical protein